jgi:hypothetical protein
MRAFVTAVALLTMLAVPGWVQNVEPQKSDHNLIVLRQTGPSHPATTDRGKFARIAAACQLMVLGRDKTHLANTCTNKPVFMNGEAAWSAIVQLDDTEARSRWVVCIARP